MRVVMMVMVALPAPTTQGSIFRIERQRAHRKSPIRATVHRNAFQVTPVSC